MHAETDFQLIEAQASGAQSGQSWVREKRTHPYAKFSRSEGARQTEHITAIIGKNGTGKSHLLGSIVRTFTMLEEYASGKKETLKQFPLDFLSYRVDGAFCSIDQYHHRKPEFTIDGHLVHASQLPLPQRVVALTISPFDKFPVPRPLPYSVAPAESSLYRYLGLRDRFGKSAIETLLFRSLSNLFETSENEALRRSNIGAVFEFLNLRPSITAVYRFKVSSSVRHALAQGKSLLDPDVVQDTFLLRRVEEVVNSGVDAEHLSFLLKVALTRSDGKALRLTANFEFGGILDEDFGMLQPIRRAGFLQLAGVEVTDKTGRVSDLRKGSSGQISIVSSLMALASVITNGSLVLIDEPELSLHPEWQVKYIDLLIRTFGRYLGCHFVVATHSPMVISELPSHAEVVSLDAAILPSVDELAGRSADYLLAEAFGVPTNGNLHVREMIASALRLVAAGQAHSSDFSQRMDVLRRFSAELEEEDPAKTIINNLQAIADSAGKAAS